MSRQKIYVICPDRSKPIGGVKQLYRLVDILNEQGQEAYILHKKKNFRVNWYHNNTPVVYFPNIFKKLTHNRKSKPMRFFERVVFNENMPESGSILVVPEIYGPYINLLEGHKLIIYNQNCYYSFNQYSFFKDEVSPYDNPDLLGCLVVSKDSEEYIKKFYPAIKVERIRIGLSKAFAYCAEKKKKVAFMPRKLSEDANQIYHYITKKECFRDWEFIPIDQLDEQGVADVLKESAIFLSFNHREGFGLPPVEAMACGCYVIGYAGNAGNEYFKPEYSIKIEDRNILNFVIELEKTIIQYNTNPFDIILRGKLASKYILSVYSKENEKIDINESWLRIVGNL